MGWLGPREEVSERWLSCPQALSDPALRKPLCAVGHTGRPGGKGKRPRSISRSLQETEGERQVRLTLEILPAYYYNLSLLHTFPFPRHFPTQEPSSSPHMGARGTMWASASQPLRFMVLGEEFVVIHQGVKY